MDYCVWDWCVLKWNPKTKRCEVLDDIHAPIDYYVFSKKAYWELNIILGYDVVTFGFISFVWPLHLLSLVLFSCIQFIIQAFNLLWRCIVSSRKLTVSPWCKMRREAIFAFYFGKFVYVSAGRSRKEQWEKLWTSLLVGQIWSRQPPRSRWTPLITVAPGIFHRWWEAESKKNFAIWGNSKKTWI